MVTALLYGLGTAVPLVLGAAIGLRWTLPRALLAGLMAFGAGTLVAAVSEELFGPAFESMTPALASVSLLAGAAVYVVASHLIDTRLGASAVGWALLLGAVLDGVPENVALGVSMDQGGLVLLVAIAVGNTPEAIGSGAYLRTEMGMARRRGMLLWVATGVLLVLVTVGADAAAGSIGPASIAAIQAFAGGATIAVLADTLMPEAYKEGGWWVGLATALGFLVAFQLG
ncbi:ZIP family metal transporter [Aeromicrobium sp.]|uniref:ZIP family metal transporter n=1 Tax=Aeromicrobium sp. TaxID=1871063 RepID=UPI003D6BB037